MDSLLCDVLSICHKISMGSDDDVFFDYAPHCDSYDVYVHKGGWSEKSHPIYIDMCRDIIAGNLTRTIYALSELAKGNGVEI